MNADFIGALEQLGQERGIQKEVLMEAIEAALISAYKRNFGAVENARVHIDRQSGEIRVYARKNVVETPVDPRQEVALADVQLANPTLKIGDVYETEVTPRDFGRIAAQTAKQVVVQRIREAERGIIYEEFQSREGDIVSGVVGRTEHRSVVLDLGKAEALLLPTEQVPGDSYQLNERFRAYILEVKRTTKGAQILVSRTHPGLLKRLFEMEVPEIHDGVVELKSIAREAGSRSKVAVWSREPDVDPVGACVGQKGARVQAIVTELRGEKLDIVRWDPDPAVFVANALSPAKPVAVHLEAEKIARVQVPEQQLSLAIGKEGQNARLAAKLTGYKIDISAVPVQGA